MSSSANITRLLVLGLDGFEISVAETLIANGKLPQLARLMSESATFPLDHGKHRLTGLAWEHFAIGKSPDRMQRWSAVRFDPETYEVHQEPTSDPPFVSAFADRTVVFDAPYFDLSAAPGIRGMANWGAHDPGVACSSAPAELRGEIETRFGAYPAQDCIYAFSWPDAVETERVGRALSEALRTRSRVTRWLFESRFPDWDLGLVVVSELHSIIEPMWHGMDASHPLHASPSSAAAAEAVETVYVALDEMIGELREAFPDAAFAAFSMHGMGANNADVASMLLLPEYCHRRAFGAANFVPRADWSADLEAGRPPRLAPGDSWEEAVAENLLSARDQRGLLRRVIDRGARALGLGAAPEADSDHADGLTLDLQWMPAERYRGLWREMDCFALPAFYDGRIRINLKGREAAGRVDPRDYEAFCAELEADLRTLIDPRTGKPAVLRIERPGETDPATLHPTQGDLEVVWADGPLLSFEHPSMGAFGPAPVRRTGGHTGGDGVLYLASASLERGLYERCSAFDVVPTIIELLGMTVPDEFSGESVLGHLSRGRSA